MAPIFFQIVDFSEILKLGLLLLVKTKVSSFIGKSLNLAPYSTGATTPLQLRLGVHLRVGL